MIEIIVCVNDKNGNPTGRVERIEFLDPHDLICPFIVIDCEMGYRRLSNSSVRIGRREYQWGRYGTMVGSIHHDCFTVSPWTASELANHLMGLNGRALLNQGHIELWDKWNSNTPFTWQDFVSPSVIEGDA